MKELNSTLSTEQRSKENRTHKHTKLRPDHPAHGLVTEQARHQRIDLMRSNVAHNSFELGGFTRLVQLTVTEEMDWSAESQNETVRR